MLYLDIGIDLGGSMHSMLLKNSATPIKYELKLAPMSEQKEIEISFYEGQRALVKDNKLLGKIVATHSENLGPFLIDLHVEDGKMNVSIENNLIETFELSNEATSFFILKECEEYLENDKIVKEKEKERQELKEYIYNTLNTLKQIDVSDMHKNPILEILHNGEIVSYIEEITLEEIKDVQKELEGNVNLFMHKIKGLI